MSPARATQLAAAAWTATAHAAATATAATATPGRQCRSSCFLCQSPAFQALAYGGCWVCDAVAHARRERAQWASQATRGGGVGGVAAAAAGRRLEHAGAGLVAVTVVRRWLWALGQGWGGRQCRWLGRAVAEKGVWPAAGSLWAHRVAEGRVATPAQWGCAARVMGTVMVAAPTEFPIAQLLPLSPLNCGGRRRHPSRGASPPRRYRR